MVEQAFSVNMYYSSPIHTPQEAPAVCFSFLASSVIIVAAGSCLLPPCVVPALGLRFHIPELLSDALLFRWFLLGLHFAVDLTIPFGQITVILLHKGRGGVICCYKSMH